jgi:hypothetical protein
MSEENVSESSQEINESPLVDSNIIENESVEGAEVLENTDEQTEKEPKDNPDSEVDEFVELTPAQQKKFGKERFEKALAQKEAQELRAQLEQIKQSKYIESTPSQPSAQDDEPQLEDFDYDESAYNRAMIKHEIKQEILALQQQEVKKQQFDQENEKHKQVDERIQNYAKDNKAYEEALQNTKINEFVLGVYKQCPHIRDAVLDSDFTGQLDHYLLDNPQYAEDLSKMSAAKAMKEIGRLEAKYSSKSDVESTKVVEQVKKVSKAPEPIENAKGGARKGSLGDDSSVDEVYNLLYPSK